MFQRKPKNQEIHCMRVTKNTFPGLTFVAKYAGSGVRCILNILDMIIFLEITKIAYQVYIRA